MKVVRMSHQKWVNGVVAHEPEVQREVIAVAEAIGLIAEARLARHKKDGNAKVLVEHNFKGKWADIDSMVTLQDLDNSDSPGDAKAIEFGHISNWTGEYVDGLYIVTGAAGLV